MSTSLWVMPASFSPVKRWFLVSVLIIVWPELIFRFIILTINTFAKDHSNLGGTY